MGVASGVRVRDQLDGRVVKTHTRQRHSCGDIGVFWISEGGLARSTGEMRGGLFQPFSKIKDLLGR